MLNLINELLRGGAWVSEFLMGFPNYSYATMKSASAIKGYDPSFTVSGFKTLGKSSISSFSLLLSTIRILALATRFVMPL